MNTDDTDQKSVIGKAKPHRGGAETRRTAEIERLEQLKKCRSQDWDDPR
jgi:hypothetical protein